MANFEDRVPDVGKIGWRELEIVEVGDSGLQIGDKFKAKVTFADVPTTTGTPFAKATIATPAEALAATDDSKVVTAYSLSGLELGDEIKTLRFVIGTSTAGWTIKECDYLCDGTDDQVEINAAITALPAAGGEIIILDGTYNITAKINVNKSNVTLKGNGNSTILKRMYDSIVDEGIITLTSINLCNIQKFYIDGNRSIYTASFNHGICLTSSDNNIILNTTITTLNACIYLYESNTNIITNNVNLTSSAGIFLESNSDNNTIIGNNINTGSDGILLETSSDNTITGNTCNNGDDGMIIFSNSNNNTVTGNTCNNNASNGIYIVTNTINNTITANTCNDNDIGIHLKSNSDNTNVTVNTCIRGTGLAGDYTASQYTIWLEGTDNDYNFITTNTCIGKAVVVDGGLNNDNVANKWN